MLRRQLAYGIALIGFCFASTLGAVDAPATLRPDAAVRAEVMASFFEGVPSSIVEMTTDTFGRALSGATGLDFKLGVGTDPFDVAERIEAGQLEFGIFHGVEFAWAQRKHPDLAILVLAVDRSQPLRACLMVREDSSITGFDDLKDKDIALPKRSEKHCRVFLQHELKNVPIRTVTAPANVEVALDDLCLNKVSAAIVSARSLAFYQDLKPGCFKKLRTALHSEEFPPHVIAYHSGTPTPLSLSQLRARLAGFTKRENGRELLKLWKVQRFETPATAFVQQLTEIERAYPASDSALLNR